MSAETIEQADAPAEPCTHTSVPVFQRVSIAVPDSRTGSRRPVAKPVQVCVGWACPKCYEVQPPGTWMEPKDDTPVAISTPDGPRLVAP